MATAVRSLALVTGAASGLGFELAKCCAEQGCDLVVAGDTPEIQLAAQACRDLGALVLAVQADLSTAEGVEKLWSEVQGCGQPIERVLASAGHIPDGPFLGQDFAVLRHALDASLFGTLFLLHRLGDAMRGRRRGRILVAAPAADIEPGALHDGVSAFFDHFTATLRDELGGSGVTVTCLMPGRSGGSDLAEVARRGFEAMMNEAEEANAAWQDKLRLALSHATFDPARQPHPH